MKAESLLAALGCLGQMRSQRRYRVHTFAGDILDGYHPKDESMAALEELLETFDALHKPHWHMIGNHCLYNLPREASPLFTIIGTFPHSPHVPTQDDIG